MGSGCSTMRCKNCDHMKKRIDENNVNLSNVIHLQLSCSNLSTLGRSKNLPNDSAARIFSKKSRFGIYKSYIYYRNLWSFLGKTDTVRRNNDPFFTQALIIKYFRTSNINVSTLLIQFYSDR